MFIYFILFISSYALSYLFILFYFQLYTGLVYLFYFIYLQLCTDLIYFFYLIYL